MIKNFCDICGAEIKDNELVGIFNRIKKVLSFSIGATMNPPQNIREEFFLCEKCQIKMSDYLESIKQKNVDKK
jgi:hypothetical protein